MLFTIKACLIIYAKKHPTYSPDVVVVFRGPAFSAGDEHTVNRQQSPQNIFLCQRVALQNSDRDNVCEENQSIPGVWFQEIVKEIEKALSVVWKPPCVLYLDDVFFIRNRNTSSNSTRSGSRIGPRKKRCHRKGFPFSDIHISSKSKDSTLGL